MDLKLEGTHVLITGASGGVGVVTARLFLEAGANVTLQHNRTSSTLLPLQTSYPNQCHAHPADVTSEGDIVTLFQAATSRFGPVEVLVVTHGVWPSQDVGVKDMSLERWRDTMSINLDGTFLSCKYFLKGVEAAVEEQRSLNNVSIVMVGSTAGKFGEAWHADYACTKSAMMQGLTLSLKNEIVKIHPKGRVNTVAPGWIRTPMAERAMQDPTLLYQALASTPLKKVSEPSDIAKGNVEVLRPLIASDMNSSPITPVILFLSSEAVSGNMTGVCLDVNGGMEGRLLNNPHDFA
ncbi:hypothetical protein SpCBS45565_g07084 [Spizellomyces sp. 'palustris']|nr:hypothetical protein SpCBS45565_g07084 [Spizellomyces sp. 'palustris']